MESPSVIVKTRISGVQRAFPPPAKPQYCSSISSFLRLNKIHRTYLTKSVRRAIIEMNLLVFFI